MRRIGLGILAAVIVALLVASVASAVPPNPLPDNQGTKRAQEKSPVIHEGPGGPEVISPRESELLKIVFIRYAEGFQKDKPCNNDGVCDPGEKGWCADCKGGDGGDPTPTPTPTPTPEPPATTCYGFLSGAKPRWKSAEPYRVDDPALAAAAATAVATWEGATSGDIFGAQQAGAGQWGVYDGSNSITLGDYTEPGVLGVTALWFRGKTLYEYDIMLDTEYFPVGSYDFDTVVLHEFGHAVGLADLYEDACNDQVMYGYVAPFEVREALAAGDIAGVQVLYGP